MGNIVKGGANKVKLFPLGTDLSALTIGTQLATLDQNISTAITGHEKSANLVVTLTHNKMDSAFVGIMNTYMVSTAGTTQKYYENGSPDADNGGSGIPTEYLLAVIGSGFDGGTSGNRYAKAFVCQLEGGDMTFQNDTAIQPVTKLTGIKNSALFTIQKTVFGGILSDTSGSIAIANGAMGTSLWATGV